MGSKVWVPSNSVEFHGRRDCRALASAPRVDSVSTTTRRLGMFDPCPRCLPDVPQRQHTMPWPTVLDALRERPSSTVERLRTEATRRGVTFRDWASRFVDTIAVIDLNEAERVIDLTKTRSRQSVSVTS
jgi:hypothetical protein